MDHDSRDQYAQFLLQSRVNSRLVEFREPDGTAAHGQHDRRAVATGCRRSTRSSTRTCAGELRHLQHPLADRAGARLDLPYVYLGYWIAQSPKMAYKANFRPLEARIDGDWRVLER